MSTESTPDAPGDEGGPGRRLSPTDPARFLGHVLLITAGLSLLAAGGAVALLTQTSAGQQAAARWVEGRLDDAVHGTVEIGTVTGGNLFTRSSLSSFAVRGPAGEPFVALEGVSLSYSPLGLLRGRIEFREVRIRRGSLHLRSYPEGDWNFDRIFGGLEEEGEAPHLVLHDVRLEAGRIEIRLPYEGLGSEEEVWRVAREPDGTTALALDLEEVSGRFPLLRLSHPREPVHLELDEVSGLARVVRQDLAVGGASAAITFRDTVTAEIHGARVGHSGIGGEGWVLPTDPMQYRFELEARPLDFRDLRWLPVPVPAEGSGPADLVLRSEGEYAAVDVRNASVRSGESEAEGGFSFVAAETPRFDTLDVSFHPLRLGLVDRLLDRPAAVDGYATGDLRGRGSVDLLHLEGEWTLRDTARREPPSTVGFRGEVSGTEPGVVRGLELRFREFDPRWAAFVGLPNRVRGRLDGTARVDAGRDSTFGFTADLAHTVGGEVLSRVSGDGRGDLRRDGNAEFALALEPLSLSSLEPYAEGPRLLATVAGTAEGSGPPSALRLRADLSTPRGALRVDGTFDLRAPELGYDARVEARDIQLREWLEGGPFTRLAAEGSVEGSGTDPGSLRATVDLRVLPSEVEGARIDTGLVRLRVAEGVARVDSFLVSSDVGRAEGAGSFGMGRGDRGALSVEVSAPDLSTWNRWIVPGRNPARPDTSVADLFRDFPDVGAEEAGRVPPATPSPEPGARDTLAGAAALAATLTGNLDGLTVSGRFSGRGLRYGELSADSVTADLDALGPLVLDSAGGGLRVDSVAGELTAGDLRWGERGLDSLSVRWQKGAEGAHRLRVSAVRDTTASLLAAGGIRFGEDRTDATVEVLALRLGRGSGRQTLRLAEPFRVEVAEGSLAVEGMRLVGEERGLVAVTGRISRPGRASADVEVRGLDLSQLHHLGPVPPALSGDAGATVRVRGTAASPTLEGSVFAAPLAYGAASYDSLRLDFEYADRSLRGSGGLVGADGGRVLSAEGTLEADLAFTEVADRLAAEPLDLVLRADRMRLDALELVTDGLRRVEGTATGRVRARGGPGSYRYEGEVSVAEAAADVTPLGIRLRTEGGSGRFVGSRFRMDTLVLRSGATGSLTVSGEVGLEELGDPAFALDLRARRFRAMNLRTLSLRVDGEGRLTGSYESPELRGSGRVFDGRIQVQPLLRAGEVVDLTDPEAFSLIDASLVAERRLVEDLRNPFLQNMRADLDLDVGPGLWLRSPELDVEVSGDLRLQLRPREDAVATFGTLRLLRGRYRYVLGPYSRELRIEEGTIEFVGTPGMNPNIDVTAAYRTRSPVGSVTVRVRVGGTLLDKTLSVSSDPPMSQSDQICHLLFGTGCLAAGPGRQPGVALSETFQEQLVGTIGSQLSSVLVQDTWLDYANVTLGAGLPGGGGEGERGGSLFSTSFLAGTQVEAGKYLGQDVFVTVTQPLRGTRPPGATLEWRFLQRWLLEARSVNRYPEGGLLSAAVEDRLWGLFLFHEWSF